MVWRFSGCFGIVWEQNGSSRRGGAARHRDLQGSPSNSRRGMWELIFWEMFPGLHGRCADDVRIHPWCIDSSKDSRPYRTGDSVTRSTIAETAVRQDRLMPEVESHSHYGDTRHAAISRSCRPPPLYSTDDGPFKS